MDRLTKTEFHSLKACDECVEFDECQQRQCVQVYDALLRLKSYEDLESQLQEVYGECDGLLEESVKYLVEHEGIDLDNPGKARLLTDDSVDKWLRWKELDKDGQLLELPCKVGDTVYAIDWEKWCKHEDEYKDSNKCVFCPYEHCESGMEYFVKAVPVTLACIANIVWHKENPSDNFRVYLTYEEAMKALEEMKNDGK